ncbi:MAG: sulfatase-like hydrolase/transferase [Pseudomonadota bacterium]|nr:sulfatase-like hydrolase/transferase [Pseudomonadota bacterium]
MLLALLACTPPVPAPTPGANVLLVTLDTLRADALGTYRGPGSASQGAPTPNLDRLAREGARFDSAYTVTPLTIPAHASIFTGLWPPRHGVRDNGELFLGDDANTLAEVLKAGGYATMASVGAEVTSHHWGFQQGFDAFFDQMGPGGNGARRWAVERRADSVVREALSWLRPRIEAKTPWFGWVHLYDAHDPYRPPEPYATTYADRPYAGEVAWVDAQVGELLRGLEQAGALEDTWVIAVADHGESLGEHGEATHGVLLYEGATRVPLLVRPPTGTRWVPEGGSVIDANVSLVDVMPTVLGALGLPVPAGLDGQDLLGMLGGGKGEPSERAVYAESLYAWRHFGWAPQYLLVTPTHTLLDSTTPELYTRADRAQATDLAASGASAADASALAPHKARLATLQAAMTPVLAAHAPGPAASTDAGSADRAAMLEALGYLSGQSESGRDAAGAPLAGLPDPVDRLPVLAEVEKARTAYRAGDLVTARKTAEAAVAADPGLVETQMLLAAILWRTGDPAAAWDVTSKVDAARPTSQTKHLLGLLKLQLGKPEEAVLLLGEAVARDPTSAASTETWLQTLLMLEDLPALTAAVATARTHLPDSGIVLGLDGVARALTGDTTGARPLLDAAIRQQPNQPFVHHALGVTLRAQGDTAGAQAAFAEEIRRFPPASASRRALAELERVR